MNIEWLWTDIGSQMWCIGLAALIFDVIAILAMLALIVGGLISGIAWLDIGSIGWTSKEPKVPEVSPEEVRAYRRSRDYED